MATFRLYRNFRTFFNNTFPYPLLCKSYFFLAENDTRCPCSCDYMDKIDYWKNRSNEYANKTLIEIYNELLPQLEATKKALEEDKTQLSSYHAKKTSAKDSRPSAKQVGSTFGIIFICIFLGLVIAFDLSSYKRHLRTIRFCRRRLWFIDMHQISYCCYFLLHEFYFLVFAVWLLKGQYNNLLFTRVLFFGKSKIIFESILGFRHSGTTIGIDLHCKSCCCLLFLHVCCYDKASFLLTSTVLNLMHGDLYRYSITRTLYCYSLKKVPLPPHKLTVLHVVLSISGTDLNRSLLHILLNVMWILPL